MRLQVFLSHNGVCSRRKAMEIIQQGHVTVNGAVNREPSTQVEPGIDRIAVNGQLVEAKKYDYILLNKPAGYVTTKEDVHAEKTVLDLLPQHYRHVAPVGRLDKDTEGLLLLTNDGQLAFELTHPKFDVDKTYVVRVNGKLTDEQKSRLEKGVAIDGEPTAPCRIEQVKDVKKVSEFLLTIHEGRKRQIRLMLHAVGLRVDYLKRIAQGPLKLGELPKGRWRVLTENEIKALKKANASA